MDPGRSTLIRSNKAEGMRSSVEGAAKRAEKQRVGLEAEQLHDPASSQSPASGGAGATSFIHLQRNGGWPAMHSGTNWIVQVSRRKKSLNMEK